MIEWCIDFKELEKEQFLLVEMEEDKIQISYMVPLVYHLIDKEIFMSPIVGMIEYSKICIYIK